MVGSSPGLCIMHRVVSLKKKLHSTLSFSTQVSKQVTGGVVMLLEKLITLDKEFAQDQLMIPGSTFLLFARFFKVGFKLR